MRIKPWHSNYHTGNTEWMGTITISTISILRYSSQCLEMLRSQKTQICLTPEHTLLTTELRCLPIVHANVSVQKFPFFVSYLISSGSHLPRIKKISSGPFSRNMCFFCLLVPKVNILKLASPYNYFTQIWFCGGWKYFQVNAQLNILRLYHGAPALYQSRFQLNGPCNFIIMHVSDLPETSFSLRGSSRQHLALLWKSTKGSCLWVHHITSSQP